MLKHFQLGQQLIERHVKLYNYIYIYMMIKNPMHASSPLYMTMNFFGFVNY